MSTHTINEAARQDARRLMNSAMLRVAATAVASVLFALIHCTEATDGGHSFASAAVNVTAPAVAQAAAALPADAPDHHVGADTHTRRN